MQPQIAILGNVAGLTSLPLSHLSNGTAYADCVLVEYLPILNHGNSEHTLT